MKNSFLMLLFIGCTSVAFSQTGSKSDLCVTMIDSRRSDQSDPITFIHFCYNGSSNCTDYWSCGLVPSDSKSKEMLALLIYAWQNGKKVDVDFDNASQYNNYGRIKRVLVRNATCQ
jgi:hypothetical protein